MTDKLVVFVNCSSLGEASNIARSLVDLQLAACVSVGTHSLSIYVWQGQRQEGTEYPLTIKTRADKWAALVAEVKRLHSYKVPEILAVPVVEGSDAYLKWIDERLSEQASQA